METQEKSKTEVQDQGPKKGIVIIVITILLGTNGLLLWQFFEKKNSLDIANQTIITTTAEKDALQTQLNQVKSDYEKTKAENTSLEGQLSEKDDEIKAKVAEIQKLIAIGGPAQIAKAKAELAKLKEMNAVYLTQIDSLNKVNTQLQSENQNLTSNLTSEKSKVENLSSENSKLASKVAVGSILRAFNIATEAVKYKSNGKEVVTSKAKQVQKIRTKFILGENKVLEKGPTDIYVRVLGPDGAAMSTTQETLTSGGQSLVYTVKQSVDYDNADKPVEIFWAKGSQFTKGKYNVELYHAGALIGKSSIELK
ncbi:MAG: hypothetical protein NT126_00210 [Bacteroidetes bacterium]|nr:hypothetical protein [Bacteroidota bacterium]